MKTFEITFTEDKNSNVYSANLCKAETAEQARAYFQTLGDCEIIGIVETNAPPRPGQPVHIVPTIKEKKEITNEKL